MSPVALTPRPALLLVLLATLATLAGATGCRRGPAAGAGVAGLEQAFPAGTAQVPGEAGDAVRLALAAAQTNDFATAVIALQGAKSAHGLTAEQLAAIETAAQDLTSDLVRRAEAGDTGARTSLKAIERSRSQ